MIEEIELHRDALRALCRRFHVRRLELFGSAARGDFDSERSDIDFLVEFDQSEPEALSLKTYLDLKDSLEALLARPVDLVEPNALRNPYLRASIEGSREPVFEASLQEPPVGRKRGGGRYRIDDGGQMAAPGNCNLKSVRGGLHATNQL